MPKKLMLIVNPVSGKGQVRGAIFDILTVFAKHGYIVDLYMTGKSGDAEEFAKTYGGDYPLLVCTGGDGTLSEVISGLVPLEEKPLLGYIPMGTANDVATTLNLSRTPKNAAEDIMLGEPVSFDVGSLDDKHFSYIAAFGAFTDVSYTTPQETKRALGHLAYVLEGMARLPLLKHHHAVVEYDGGETFEGDFIFGAVTNSTSVAGLMKIDPNAVGLGDGQFEIILIQNPKKISEMNSIINAVLTQSFNNENVLMLHTNHIKFTFDEPVAWTRDGENGGTHQVAEAKNIPQAVQIIVHSHKK